MTPTTFATSEGFESSEARCKRLGQYFSGLPLAKLLVALTARSDIRSVVDPMAGKADMLVASTAVLPKVEQADGIEIDPLAHEQCHELLGQLTDVKTRCLLGSAFDWAQVSKLDPTGYDLCATNPPYVRYQAQRESAGAAIKLPSATEVRAGLINCLERLTSLSKTDRQAFLTLARGYSGLADLAVPSWILCAALVKVGGTLAMVVPEAWLNRDYASVVQYLLARWFRIEYIVEDAHAVWFAEAQVKTTLLVARRIEMRTTVHDWGAEEYLHIVLPSCLATPNSLIGCSELVKKNQPEMAFAKMAKAVLTGKSTALLPGVQWQRVRIADQVKAASSRARDEEWFRNLEPASVQTISKFFLPPVLGNWFGDYRAFTTLDELGVEVGQGLRTGANEFFYAELLKHGSGASQVRLSKLFNDKVVSIPNACLPRVVRKQSDLPMGFAVEPKSLNGVALAFHGWALPEHAKSARAKPLPAAIAGHIQAASRTYAKGPGSKLIPALTAVAPNERPANMRTGAPARFWYMLPDFAPRHRPDLFIARVNAERPRILLNPGREALVDANFSTVWVRPDSVVTPHGLLALLNSSLSAFLFEHLGSVMGGGALKLESTHLRTMPIPKLSKQCWKLLDHFGKELSEPSGNYLTTRLEIDIEVCTCMFGANMAVDKVQALKEAIKLRQSARNKSYDANPGDPSTAVPC